MKDRAKRTKRDSGILPDDVRRLQMHVRGTVQGVGFRPFVYRLAKRFDLAGWVCNTTHGVIIEVEGHATSLSSFLESMNTEAPPLAVITDYRHTYHKVCGYRGFEVRESTEDGAPTTRVLPDAATCPDCIREMFDPQDRRFRYPFINCTNCGPRYSIIEALPYDRKHTSMRTFPMCDACREEYENPGDRRFHAQPNACPECGPHLELWDRRGNAVADKDEALLAACEHIRGGKILALKGLGGFQLIVDARNESAVRRLRDRKSREEKPLAIMSPTPESVRSLCETTEREIQLLTSHRAPIVLLRKRRQSGDEHIAPSVAPDNPFLGVMLPYTPLHHLMMTELGFPVVATSGNLSDEPICIDEYEALERLNDIADSFLVHNRPIVRQMDDSVVRIMAGQEQVIRSARGYAPTPLTLSELVGPAIAVGGHLKNSSAVASGHQVYLSQHIGDLDTALARDALKAVTTSLKTLYDIQPAVIIHDCHPDYASTHFTREYDLPTFPVQHHYAHILSGMLDNEIEGSVLGVAWDGTGLGDDGTIWGGEFIIVDGRNYSRVAHLRQFRLPGGEAAVRESRRAAVGMLYELYGENVLSMKGNPSLNKFTDTDIRNLLRMLSRGVNCPITSSAGRVFDAVASLLDICHTNIYEGQAAMAVGFLAEKSMTDENYPFSVDYFAEPLIIDWRPMMEAILDDISRADTKEMITGKFHNTLCEIIVDIANRVGEKRVVLSGGCFQNRYLSERAIERLKQAGFEPYWHHRIPPNDGGIAAGQVLALARSRKGEC